MNNNTRLAISIFLLIFLSIAFSIEMIYLKKARDLNVSWKQTANDAIDAAELLGQELERERLTSKMYKQMYETCYYEYELWHQLQHP